MRDSCGESPLYLFIALLTLCCGCETATEPTQSFSASREKVLYRAILGTPGGELPFGLELEWADDGVSATIINGTERIPVPDVSHGRDTSTLTLAFPHYDSQVVSTIDSGRHLLEGTWTKQTAKGKASMSFRASAVAALDEVYATDKLAQPVLEVQHIAGRWEVRFDGEEHVAVGVFETDAGERIQGTFLTTTGDYRYLAGALSGNALQLSCFDGAHAFLFVANVAGDSMTGDFWSGATYHDKWVARRNDEIELPDPLALAHWNENVRLADLRFMGLDGKMHSLDEPEFRGRAIVLQLFGSWCPNCHDAAAFMSKVFQQYRQDGLMVIGLAFEYSEDLRTNRRQVQRYVEKHRVSYPVLIAGLSEKDAATRSFQGLDRIKAFPTTIFVDGDGTIRAVYTGFSGPATGIEYERLQETYHRVIRGLLMPQDETEKAGD